MLKYHSLRDKVFSLKNLYAAFKRLEQYKQEGYRCILDADILVLMKMGIADGWVLNSSENMLKALGLYTSFDNCCKSWTSI